MSEFIPKLSLVTGAVALGLSQLGAVKHCGEFIADRPDKVNLNDIG